MSSIDGSGRNNQDDIARRTREEYQQKEATLTKKHNREIRRLNEQHMQDIERMRETNDKTLKNVQQNSAKSVTERDAKYRREIDKIRNMHQKQIGEIKSENQRRVELERSSSKKSLDFTKESQRERVRDLKNHYEGVLASKEKNYQSQVQGSRQKQGSAIIKQREQMQKKHSTEINELADSARREKAEIQYKFSEHREQAKAAARSQRLNNIFSQKRVSDNSMAQLQRERIAHDEQLNSLRIGFRDSLKRTRDRFQTAADRKDRTIEKDRINLKEGVDERINSQMRTLEQKIESLKNENNLDVVKLKRDSQREKNNIRASYQANIQRYEDERSQIHSSAKEQHARDLNSLQIKNDKIIDQTSKFYKERVNAQNLRHRSSYESLKNQSKAKVDQSSNQAQSRIDNIIADTNASVERLKKNYNKALETMKTDYNIEKNNLVVDMTNDKAETVQRMRDRITKKDIARAEKESALIRKYEQRIATLSDKSIQDKRAIASRHRLLLKQIASANKDALETQKIQYIEKLDSLRGDQKIELARVNQKHRQQMDAVLNAVRKG